VRSAFRFFALSFVKVCFQENEASYVSIGEAEKDEKP